MAHDLTPDERALLARLEALFDVPGPETQPPELRRTLKQQIRDRLAPDTLSAGETVAVTVVAVAALGFGGVHTWDPFELVGSGLAVALFVRAAHWLTTRSRIAQ